MKGVSEAQVIYYLRKLKEAGIIQREGPDKGGKWVINSDN
jgi:DNA-binding Lrp family transcriptional regulator